MDNITLSIILYFIILCIIFINTNDQFNDQTIYLSFSIIAVICYCFVNTIYNYFNINSTN